MEDDDDASIGLPSLNSAAFSGPRGSTSALLDLDTQMDSDQEDLDPEISLGSLNTTSDLASNLAGVIASNMIQAAIAGAMQPRPPQGPRRESGPRAGAAPRGYRKQSSSELDTDLDFDGEDFEMLDQSELNQLDPVGGGQGKLIEATLRHRAATITLKLVKSPGGEALANTSFSVLTPGGDVIRELIGAFPALVLAEGEYVAIARHEGKTYQNVFRVHTTRDADIEIEMKDVDMKDSEMKGADPREARPGVPAPPAGDEPPQ